MSLDEEISAVLREKLEGINATLGEAAEIIGSRASEKSALQRIFERLLPTDELECGKSEEGENKRRRGKGSVKNLDTVIEGESVRRRRQPRRAVS